VFRGYVQLVQEAFECFDRGDWDRLRPLIAEHGVMTPPEFWPDRGPFVGPDASIAEYQRLFQLFRGISVSVSDIVSHEEWVVAHYRGELQVEVPELPKELEFVGVHRFEDDRFVESHYRVDRDAAFSAAGL
jgi:ketosteroid isomerase-like protein